MPTRGKCDAAVRAFFFFLKGTVAVRECWDVEGSAISWNVAWLKTLLPTKRMRSWNQVCSKSSFYLLHVYLLTCGLSKRRKWRHFKSAQWSQSSSSVLLAFYIFYSCRKMDQDFNWELSNTVCKREKPFLQGRVPFFETFGSDLRLFFFNHCWQVLV